MCEYFLRSALVCAGVCRYVDALLLLYKKYTGAWMESVYIYVRHVIRVCLRGLW